MISSNFDIEPRQNFSFSTSRRAPQQPKYEPIVKDRAKTMLGNYESNLQRESVSKPMKQVSFKPFKNMSQPTLPESVNRNASIDKNVYGGPATSSNIESTRFVNCQFSSDLNNANTILNKNKLMIHRSRMNSVNRVGVIKERQYDSQQNSMVTNSPDRKESKLQSSTRQQKLQFGSKGVAQELMNNAMHGRYRAKTKQQLYPSVEIDHQSTSRIKKLPELTKFDSFRIPTNGGSKSKPETRASTNTRVRANRPLNDPNTIGFGAYDQADKSNLSTNRIPKQHVRCFDQKRLQQFVYQQDGFSAALDKKLGFQYSDKFSIKQMREEIMAIMSKVNKKGKYSQYLAPEKREDTIYSYTHAEQNLDSASTPMINDFSTPVYDQRLTSDLQTADLDIKTAAKNQQTERQTTGIAEQLKNHQQTHSLYSSQMEPLKSHRNHQLYQQPLKIGKTQTQTMNNSSIQDFDRETAFESSPQTRRNGSQSPTMQHQLHTVNSKMSNISKISTINNRLSEFRMIVQDTKCPKFQKMKDKADQQQLQKLSMTHQRREMRNRKNNMSSLMDSNANGTNNQSLSELQKQIMTPNGFETQFLDQDMYSQYTLKNVVINQTGSAKRINNNPIITNEQEIHDQVDQLGENSSLLGPLSTFRSPVQHQLFHRHSVRNSNLKNVAMKKQYQMMQQQPQVANGLNVGENSPQLHMVQNKVGVQSGNDYMVGEVIREQPPQQEHTQTNSPHKSMLISPKDQQPVENQEQQMVLGQSDSNNILIQDS